MTGYNLIRSKRKSISISVSRDMQIIVRAPIKMPVKDIEYFIIKHTAWIEKQTLRIQELRNKQRILSEEEIKALKEKARTYITQRVAYYSDIMGLRASRVKISSAVTRLGSCSATNSLNFSYRLMLLPDELIDYIVVHELAHIKEKNHSARFYDVVASYMPDYKSRWAKLKALSASLFL